MDSIFSLTRFFMLSQKKYPCCVAGRVYKVKDSENFLLKSQDLKLECKPKNKVSFNEGDWISVKVLDFDGSIANAKPLKVLSSCKTKADTNSKHQVATEWFYFLKTVESYFLTQGLSYAETPSLVNCPGTEPHLETFQTDLKINSGSQKMFLATSPEMHLKKLLCQDWTDFFEIKKCFRNGEVSATHEPEFYMLEWYRAFFTLDDLIQDSFNFLSRLCSLKLFKGKTGNLKVVTTQELFKKHLGFNLTPKTTAKELLSLAKTQGLSCSQESSFEDLFFLLFLNFIENKFAPDDFTVVKNYPPSMRAFSRIDEQGWASRFEIYWRGFELANAFYEIIDPTEQKKVFEQHLAERKDLVPEDKELLSAMEQGMPPCAGIALGLERLFLALTKRNDIASIKAFPFNK